MEAHEEGFLEIARFREPSEKVIGQNPAQMDAHGDGAVTIVRERWRRQDFRGMRRTRRKFLLPTNEVPHHC
jgi:hypothetical protein